MNSTFSSKSTETKQLARQGIEAVLPPKQTGRPLPLLLSHSYAVGRPKDHPGGGGREAWSDILSQPALQGRGFNTIAISVQSELIHIIISNYSTLQLCRGINLRSS